MANGYGINQFGYDSYGSIDVSDPTISNAKSITPFQILVTFSEQMNQFSVTNPNVWTLTPSVGAPVTIFTVAIASVGPSGVLSIVLGHTGTTLGGTYELTAFGPVDLFGNPLSNTATFIAMGGPPGYTITPLSGTQLLVEFDQDLSDAGDVADYVLASQISYPIQAEVTAVTWPYGGNNRVLLTVRHQTSLTYDLKCSPATAITYDGSVLPSAASGFTGVETGVGNSVISNGQLVMSSGSSYGWLFEDTSSKITTTSALRVDWVFDFNGSFPLGAPVEPLAFLVEDSTIGAGTGILVALSWSGTEARLQFFSGGYSELVTADWTSGEHTVSLVRNPVVGIWTLLFDGESLLSPVFADLDVAATINAPGLGILIDGVVSGFKVISVNCTSSATIYSAALNFFHNQTNAFVGSAALANNVILTKRGPLVKDWGDATPATVSDVEVRVNSTVVPVEAVNPWHGSILLETPIPYMPPGEIDVKVDYQWMASPVMEFGGLNTLGCILNQYSTQGVGIAYGRFPMGMVLPPYAPIQPLNIGHRYLGFERDYTASLNSPTTLLLNQAPNWYQSPQFNRPIVGSSFAFEGTSNPSDWTLIGADTGHLNDDGTYTLGNNRDCAVYRKSLDFDSMTRGYFVGRFKIDSATPDGVYTGVGFGSHDNKRLYVVGALEVNGLRHIGFLTNAERPDLVTSWSIGPKAILRLISQNSFEITTTDLPLGVGIGDRFQVLTGTQTGVYTVASVSKSIRTGKTTIGITGVFPAKWDIAGNRTPTVYFEHDWTVVATYRLEVDPENRQGRVVVSGEMRGSFSFTGSADRIPLPSNTSLVLPPKENGQVFWGNLSKLTISSTVWSFYRSGLSITNASQLSPEVIFNASSESDLLPEDMTNPWYKVGLGRALNDSSDLILCQSIAGSNTDAYSPDLANGYTRLEPFLSRVSQVDVRAKYQVDYTASAFSGAEIIINDGVKEVRLGNLQYAEGGTPYRKLFDNAYVSLSGLLGYSDWIQTGNITAAQRGSFTTFTQNSDTLSLSKNLDTSGMFGHDSGSRVSEVSLSIDSYTAGAGNKVNVCFTMNWGSNSRTTLSFIAGGTPAIALYNDVALIGSYPFDWTDAAEHTYKMVATAGGSLALFIDGAIQAPTLAEALFAGGSDNTSVKFEIRSGSTATVTLRSLFCVAIPEGSTHRTLGIYKGGTFSDIDSWEIPRLDVTSAANSEQVGPNIQEMDWTASTEVRLLRDPTWGITVLRTDMGFPPYHIAESNAPDSGYVTQTTDPSAGWINVEWPNLPDAPNVFSGITFGSTNPNSISQSHWDWESFKYSIFNTPSDNRIASAGMVLNRVNVISSGEATKDTTPETISIETLDTRRISLLPSDIYAKFVHKIVDGSTVFTFKDFTFDVASQTITLGLNEDGTNKTFSGTHAIVTVVFTVGTISESYLKSQPLLDSVTLLNEGTPNMAKSRTGTFEKIEPSTAVAPVRQILGFSNPSGTYYENLNHYTVDNEGKTGLIASICEGLLSNTSGLDDTFGEPIYAIRGGGASLGGVGASQGLEEDGDFVGFSQGGFILGLSGTLFTEQFSTPQSGYGEFAGGLFMVSGGSYEGSTLNLDSDHIDVLDGSSTDSIVTITIIDTVSGDETVYSFTG